MNPALSNNNSNNARKGWVKCSLCGYEFKESEEQQACKSCLMMKGCKLIRCPRCGFEMPPEPKWLKYFKKGRKSNEAK